MIPRRAVLLGALAAPAIARAQAARVLRMVPQSNLGSLDPIWTTANITRNHAYLIYDTLFGVDDDLVPQPQMAEGLSVAADGREVTITLRAGLMFHDATPVLARDAVASIKRWMVRNSYGQKLAETTDEIIPVDDRRLRFRLKKPFPLLTAALGGASQPAFVMPERVAATDAFKQITDTTGSGPFRFKRDEFNSGSLAVYERHTAYVPRGDGVPSLTSGPKRPGFDRIEWRIIPDHATASAALQNGEIDWFEQPPPELQTLLARQPGLRVEPIGPQPLIAILRLNFLHPPFDQKAMRQALLPAISQADFTTAIVGDDPALQRLDVGVFPPGTANDGRAGLEPLLGPRSVDQAKTLLKAAGYNRQPVRLIGPTDILAPAAMTQVAGDLFARLGLNVDVALSDWGTVLQRRASQEPLDKGGWSAVATAFSAFDFADPATHLLVRGNGRAGWPGWPTIPRLETLRDSWFEAPDEPTRRALCADIQRTVIDEVAFVPLGGYLSMTALRRDLIGRVPGFALFWGLRRAA